MSSSKRYQSMHSHRRVSRDGYNDDDSDGGMNMENRDDDDVTNRTNLRRESNSVKRKLRKLKSLFDFSPSRDGIYTESCHNIQLWKESSEDSTEQEIKINCAKVFNFKNLKESDFKKLKFVSKLEIEDSEKFLDDFPEALFSCCKNVTHFSFSWSKIKTIPKELMHEKLKCLKLNDNSIRSLNGLGSTNNLETLILKNNNLHNIPHCIFDLFKLKHLDLRGNDIKELPDLFANLKKLSLLDLSANRIKVLPSSMGDLKELNVLKINKNIIFSLNPSLSKLTSLSDLQSSSNQLNSLPLSFESLQTLQSLSLSYNFFKTIPTCLFNLTNLKTLNMRNNQIQVISDALNYVTCLNVNNNLLKQLPPSLFQSSSITQLYLNNNNLKIIPDIISQLSQLQVLHLDDNLHIKCLPDTILNLHSLKHISITNTSIPNTFIKKLEENNISVLGNSNINLERDLKSATIAQNPLRSNYDSIYPPKLNTNQTKTNLKNKTWTNEDRVKMADTSFINAGMDAYDSVITNKKCPSYNPSKNDNYPTNPRNNDSNTTSEITFQNDTDSISSPIPWKTSTKKLKTQSINQPSMDMNHNIQSLKHKPTQFNV